MQKINIVLCGCGFRGEGLLATISINPDYNIVAVCDPYLDKAERVQKALKEKRNLSVKVYTDHIKMFDETKPDAVIVATSWEEHVKVAIDGMERGIAAALEVGTAYNEQECWDLVNAYERTKTPVMFMENCCFGKEELLATSLVRNGVFGKIVYCHGAYGHDLRNEVSYGNINRHYRLRNYINRNCDNYPTHELGPIAKILNINRGNRMLSLVSRSSMALGLKEYVKNKPELKELHDVDFKQGDIVETIITCENGEMISLKLDTTLPRFYSREFTVRGTAGMYNQDGNMVLEDGKFEEIWTPYKSYQKFLNNAENYYEKYLPAFWINTPEEIKKAGHGGMDYYEFAVFADCLKNKKEMPIDVYDGVCYMAISYLTEKSIAGNGTIVEIPDFTKGKYKERSPQDVVELPKVSK